MRATDEYPDLPTRLAAFFQEAREPTFLVGGFIRDALLSRPGRDLDLAVAGNPEDIGRTLARYLSGTFVPIGPAHDTCRIVVGNPVDNLTDDGTDYAGGADSQAGQFHIDITGFQHGIEQDLRRRDFTINALALPVSEWRAERWADRVIDPTGGVADLAAKRVRATGDGVFPDDPARLLRAVRLAARLNFRLEPATAQSIRRHAHRIERVSPERVRDELLAILAADGAKAAVEVLDRLDLLCRVIPELGITKGVDQPRVHYWDVWGHSIHAVETAELVTKGHQNSAIYSLVPWTPEHKRRFDETVSDGHTRRTILKLTALLHDIAKPQTKARDDTGRTRFLGHSELGAEMVEHRLGQLRFSSRGIAMVSKMVEQHLRPATMQQGTDMPTRRAVYRYFRDLQDVAIDTLYLAMADYLAAKGPEVIHGDWARHAKIMLYIMQTGAEQPSAERPVRLITGHDLMREFALGPGPVIGEMLERIKEAHAAGEIATRQEALDMAAAFINGRTGNPGGQE